MRNHEQTNIVGRYSFFSAPSRRHRIGISNDIDKQQDNILDEMESETHKKKTTSKRTNERSDQSGVVPLPAMTR
jgi:hypothetical protein